MLYYLKCPILSKKKIETHTHKIEKYSPYTRTRSSIITVAEGAQVLSLIDSKSEIARIFMQLKKTIAKEIKDSLIIISHQPENINKEIKIK